MQATALSASAEAFAAMKAAWGVQAFGSMFAGMSNDEMAQTHELWDRALEPFGRATLKLVLSDFVRRGDRFPPTLPQLVAACNAKGHAAKQPALALDRPRTSTAQAERNLRRVHSAIAKVDAPEPMSAYRQPKSALVARTLIDAAQRDSRLLEILREHGRTGCEACRSDDTANVLRAFFRQPPTWYAA